MPDPRCNLQSALLSNRCGGACPGESGWAAVCGDLAIPARLVMPQHVHGSIILVQLLHLHFIPALPRPIPAVAPMLAPGGGGRRARTRAAPVRHDNRCSTPPESSCRIHGYWCAQPRARGAGRLRGGCDYHHIHHGRRKGDGARSCCPDGALRLFNTAGRNTARTSDAPRRLGSIVRVNQDGSPPRK